MRPRFLIPSLLLCFATPSFAIVDATSMTNTTNPGGGVPWANVGRVNGGSGEYLGNGWVLTAAHVGAGAIVLDSGTFQPDGRVIRLKNPDNSLADILLYHLILTPSLPGLVVSGTTPATYSEVDLVGYGRISDSNLNTTYTNPEHPEWGTFSGFNWSTNGAKSFGTNRIQYAVVPRFIQGAGTLWAFTLDFTQSVFAGRTSREAQVATGDSGGAVFFNNGATWELAGMIDALGSYVIGQPASVYGDESYIADLATYSSQINALTASTAGGANWSGTNGGTWSTAGNWSASPVPGAINNIHTATFNSAGNGNTTVSLAGGVTINTVLFDTASAAAYTIGSGVVGSQTLTLKNGGAITTSSTVSNGQLFNAALTLGDDATAQTYTISNNTTASPTPSVTLAGGITGATGGTAGAKILAVVGSGHTAISGGISTGGAASLTVNKSGSGTLDLSGAQTYSALTAAGGTTHVNSALGSGNSSVSVSGNGTALKFGTVSQRLSSLTIGAGATVTFTSGPASFADTDDTKALSFGGGPPAAGVVPEPGTAGLILLGAISVLSSRRKRPLLSRSQS